MEGLNKLIEESEIESYLGRISKLISKFQTRIKSLAVEIELEFNYPITDQKMETKVINWIKEVETYLQFYRKKFINYSNWINSAVKWTENFDKLKQLMSTEETKRIRDIRRELQKTDHLIGGEIESIDTIINVLQNPLKIEIPLIEPKSQTPSTSPTE